MTASATAAATGTMTSAVTFMAGFSEVILLASVLPVGGGSRCAQAALHTAAKKSRYPLHRRSRRSLWCTASFTLAIATALVAATTLQLSPSSSAGAASPLPRFRRVPDFAGNTSSSPGCRDSVHIAMTLDAAYLRGSMAAVFSVLRHSSCPGSVVFHFLASEGESELSALLRTTFPSLRFRVYHFDESLVRSRISSSVRQALEQPLNYARNYLAEILDSRVRRVIYLDSDLVVVDDITKLWNTRLSSRAVIGAPEYCHANLSRYFTQAFWSDPDLSGAAFRGRNNPPCYFNTGVMVMDLERWRRRGYTRVLERWMQVQKEKRIYELGSLPPFLLVFAGRVEPVAHRWNQHGLGGDNVKGSCRPLHPGPVSLLHWSGNGKPWTRLDSHKPCPIDSLWAPYDLYLPE